MKIKKVLVSVIAMIMAIFIATPVSAHAETGPGYPGPIDTWNVLVLILPNASVVRKGNTSVTTMHYGEIEQVKKMAKDMESWTTGRLGIKVDVKVDYQAIKNCSFSQAFGYRVNPGNVEEQIKKNSTKGQYDSVLVVYRGSDNQGGTIGTTKSVFPRNDEANGATYATLPLLDGDHKMEMFNVAKPEQFLMKPLLRSVDAELSLTHDNLPSIPFADDPAQNAFFMKRYMMDSNKQSIGDYWTEFTLADM